MSAPVQNVVPLTDEEAKYVIALVTREMLARVLADAERGVDRGYGDLVAVRASVPIVEAIIREFNDEHGEPGLDQLAGKLTVGAGGPG